jgi:alkylation response protein AidB-like acyl-CoA dehydrogenase
LLIVDATEEQELLARTARRFLSSELPLVRVRELADSENGYDRDWWKLVADLGWTSLLVSQEHGGAADGDIGLVGLVLVAEEIGRFVSPGPLMSINLVAGAISSAGTEQQRTEILVDLMSGEKIASWCVAEPQSSYGASGVHLRAEQSGSTLALHGVKSPVEAANSANLFLVTARLDGELIQVLVPADAPGVYVETLGCIDLVRRFGEVRFDGVSVPLTAVIPHPNVTRALEGQLQIAAILGCAEMTGVADHVFQFTLDYLFHRYSFGRSLASYQALKHRVADMKTFLEACKGTTEAAARSCEAREDQADMLTSVAKAWVSDVVPELIQECVQLHGGIGVTWEHDLHLYLRRVTVDRSLNGTPTDHRERIASYLVDESNR